MFTGVDNNMKIAREEIFGPVLTVIAYRDEAEALRIGNDSEYGLAGSVFTNDTEQGLDVAMHVRTGTFGVNEGYVMDPAAPSGVKKAAATDANWVVRGSRVSSTSSRSRSRDDLSARRPSPASTHRRKPRPSLACHDVRTALCFTCRAIRGACPGGIQ
jgi:hypothetical protein